MKIRPDFFFGIGTAFLLVVGCSGSSVEWRFEKTIHLNGIKPLGIIVEKENLWLSDVDHNRIVKTDTDGIVLRSIIGLGRPMHIALNGGKIYIPEFLHYNITIIDGEKMTTMLLDISPDAPGGIDVKNGIKAIVDFYNHRLILIDHGKHSVIGKKGHADGELNYPIDVTLFEDKIFVADAYNNRVQVFDHSGKVLQVIGWREEIKVAAGLAVGPDRVYVTDFHGNRVLIYNFFGELIKILTTDLDMPTDIFVSSDRMYVANYGGGFITVFHLK